MLCAISTGFRVKWNTQVLSADICVLEHITEYPYKSNPKFTPNKIYVKTGKPWVGLSAFVYLLLCGFCSVWLPLPQGACDGLRYFIVALPEPSI